MQKKLTLAHDAGTLSPSEYTEPEKDFCSQDVPTEEDSSTGTLCTDCAEGAINAHARMGEGASMQEIKNFLGQVDKKSRLFKKQEKSAFKNFANTFCRSCQPVDVKNFINYVKEKSLKQNIPPEIMFSLLMKESRGACGTGPGKNCDYQTSLVCSDRRENKPGRAEAIREYNQQCRGQNRIDGSFGLFQLNLRYPNLCDYKVRNTCSLQGLNDKALQAACAGHSEKPTCMRYKGNKINNYGECQVEPNLQQAKEKGVCINNPYCGFEEALHLLKRKFKSEYVKAGGVKLPSPQTQWTDLSPEQRDLFRNAVMAYNSSTALKGSYSYMKRKNLPSPAEMRKFTGMKGLSGWELQRMFVLNAAISRANSKGKSKEDVIQSSADQTRYRFPNHSKNRDQWLDMLANLSYMEQITGREVKGGGKNSLVCQWRSYEDNVEGCPPTGRSFPPAVEMPSYGSGSSHAVEMPSYGSGSSHAVEMPGY